MHKRHRRKCTRKARWDEQSDAVAAIIRINKNKNYRKGYLYSYKCGNCNHWHISKRSGEWPFDKDVKLDDL